MKTILLTTLLLAVFTSFTPRCHSQPQLELANSGFEIYEPTSGGLATAFGDWRWDFSTIRLLPEGGISPRSGSGMLQFLGTANNGAGSSTACEMAQLVSLEPVRALLASGWTVIVTQTCYFNRVAGDFQTDSVFSGQMDTYGVSASASAGLHSDPDPATWERVEFSLTIPSAATHLRVKLAAGENIFNDTVFPELDGHFADDVSLTVGINPPSPQLNVQLLPDSQVMLTWPTVSGFTYQLLRSPSLDAPDWQLFGDPWFGDGFDAAGFDLPAVAPSQAYYRLRITGIP